MTRAQAASGQSFTSDFTKLSFITKKCSQSGRNPDLIREQELSSRGSFKITSWTH